MIAFTMQLASDRLPPAGSFAGDLISVAVAVVTFALLYWAVNLFDRI